MSNWNNYRYRQVKAIQKTNEERLLKVCPNLNNKAGIYFFTREENGINYAYVGQAKHLIERLVSHLMGYSHIDLSIKKRGLFPTKENGWKLTFENCEETELDEKERFYIKEYATNGFQLYNKTTGGQDNEKSGLGENKSGKGYHDGLKQGYKNCLRDIKELFDKYLYAMPKQDLKKNGDIKEINLKKLKEFEELMKGEENV